MTDTRKCRIKWFAVCGGELIPRTKGFQHNAWEAKCETHGWATHSGGAIAASIQRDIDDHKWDVDPDGMIAKLDAQSARRQVKFDEFMREHSE